MKSSLIALTMTTVAGFTGLMPRATAAGDNITFNMVRAAGATCLSNHAHGRVTVSDLGPVQNMHVEVVGLTPNNDFTLFLYAAFGETVRPELVPRRDPYRQRRERRRRLHWDLQRGNLRARRYCGADE